MVAMIGILEVTCQHKQIVQLREASDELHELTFQSGCLCLPERPQAIRHTKVIIRARGERSGGPAPTFLRASLR